MKRWLAVIGVVIIIVLGWLLTSDSDRIWPTRNFLQYQLLSRWWQIVGEPQTGPSGVLSGVLRDEQGRPIEAAWVLVSRWDGTTYRARTTTDGQYRIEGAPAGRYMPIAMAPGFEDTTLGRVTLRADQDTVIEATLPPEPPRDVAPGEDLVIGEATPAACDAPLAGAATRRQISFDNAGEPNQLTYFYTPSEVEPDDRYPVLLIVYPGPADEWECIGVPLAAAGYATLGVGPVYSFDFAGQLDELQRLLGFVEAGRLPNADPDHVAALAGSFSGLHVQHLIRRKADLQAAVLLGAPTDIFAMRHHLEERTFIPPFGLDKLLIALGLPDRQPELYAYISDLYHIESGSPPLLLIHSRTDEVVPVDQTELLVEALAYYGVPYQVHYFDGASHYLMSAGGEAQAIFDVTLEFLNNRLKNQD
jgi:acetyl esterase/lipase